MILLNSNLSAFLAVVENLTVSAAAKKLRLTQTGTTQRIKALERDLGVTLFLRSRSGMKLTAEGSALLRNCLQVKELENRMTSEIRNGGVDHDVDLAITGPGGLIARRIIPQCAKICEKWPKLNLRFVAEVQADRLNLLKRGVVDLAIVLSHEVKNEMDSKLIAPTELIMVAPYAWRKRELKAILQTERLIAYHPDDPLGVGYLTEFNLLSALGRTRLYANDNEMVLSMVRLGIGFALLPKEFVQPYIDEKVLIALNAGRSKKIPFALTWYPRSEMPSYFKDLIREIK